MFEPAPRSSGTVERPLSPAARGGLVVRAALTILLFYLTAIAFMAALGALALLLLIVVLGAARFGLAGFVTQLLAVPVRLLGILGRKLWLWAGPTYGIVLSHTEAPALFALSSDLSRRSGLPPPESISIEMHVNAWVQMSGFRRGAGRTRLGIGFDLLAGLTVREVEAVLAHELAHARRVQRGFSRWLKKGLARLVQVTAELSACAAGHRQAGSASDLADGTLRVFDGLTRRAARLVATYSRQDEFEADRGAAELCGAAAIRRALVRLEELGERVAGLAWSERLARLQPGETFTDWLVSELTAPGRGAGTEELRHAADPYSTHPALRDRLAALPGEDAPPRDARPGISLLANPDRVAERLVAEIQRVNAAHERNDTRRLARETRRFCTPEATNGVAAAGAIALITGLIFGAIAIGDGFPLDATVTAAIAVTAGAVLLRRSRYRDRRPLPVPAFGTLLSPRPPTETHEQLVAAEEAIVAELRAAADRERTRRDRVAMLVGASYAALAERDYLRAHVAARLALELSPKSIEAGLGYAVAAAGLGNAQQMHARLRVIKHDVGFRTVATKWGAAWALSLVDDWSCEGLLQQVHDLEPQVATYASLLALAQLYRQKVQSATTNAETGVRLEPGNRAARLHFANALLIAGRTAEAAAQLDGLQDYARTMLHGTFLMVRLRLMERDTAGAQQWAEAARGLDPDGESLVGLGHVFGAARVSDPAVAFYEAAAVAGFGPQAHLGLSVLAFARGDRTTARMHLLSALKFDGARFTKGLAMGDVFHEILGRLIGLAERRDCRAWIAALPGGSAELAGRSVLVCARDESEARGHLETIMMAMQGAESGRYVAGAKWRLAPPEQQPDRPVAPGVYSVVL